MKNQITSQFYKKLMIGLLVFSLLMFAGCSAIFEKLLTTEQTNGMESEFSPSAAVSENKQTQVISPTNSPVVDKTIPVEEQHQTFYISKQGSNGTGTTWKTAWNELNQISWDQIRAGDTIIIGGGTYHTNLDVQKSGAPDLPITITTNGEQVILDGQLPALPYCGELGYVEKQGEDGIDLEGRSFIVIEGKDWRGIVIRNHKRGIMMRRGASNIIIRNVEISDNGWPRNLDEGFAPDGPGVELGGSNIVFDRVIIHDNGQDAFQAGWGVWNFTLRNSWLFNSREHPIERGKPFNHCSHTDGIQIYDGGIQGPVVIEDSIIGPSFTQGMMINNKAAVNDVLISNTLIVGNWNSGISIQTGGDSSNWMLQNVTVVQDPEYEGWSVKLEGSNHRVRDSFFWGGPWGIGIQSLEEASGNYRWLTRDRNNLAIEIDPMFLDDDYSRVQGNDFATFNYRIQSLEIPSGTGARITSIEQLLNTVKDEIR